MFTDEELDHLAPALPDRCFLEKRNEPESIDISSMIWAAYPVKGLINPLAIMEELGKADPSVPHRFNLGLCGRLPPQYGKS